MMKFHTIRLSVRKRHTSAALVISRISLHDDLKVLALSEFSVAGSPSRLANRLNIGNPGSLCVTRDITQVNYREHMRRSLRLKICWKMELKIVETYYVASFCCP